MTSTEQFAKKHRLYWITSRDLAHGYPKEASVFSTLKAANADVIPIVWDQETLPKIGENDLVIVRTPWDYLKKFSNFMTWMASLPEDRVHNSKSVLKWNAKKDYLRELESEGIPLLPTRWIFADDEESLREEILAAFPGLNIVLKPVLGAGAFQTYRLGPAEFPPIGEFTQRAAMIQPFMPEILTDGERSLVYFDGNFSHAILKKPKSGDYRVQESFGGEFSAFAPTATELAFGEKLMEYLRKKFPDADFPLYARVDYLTVKGVPHLMELELLEPDLYFHHVPEAAGRFTAALVRRSQR